MDPGIASQTEWNGGTLTNIRLHSIREELKTCSMMNDISGWLMLLVKMNHELYGFEKPEEKKQIRIDLQILAEKINKHKQGSKFAKTYRSAGIPADIIDSLNNMEYTLDEVFHKSGLQTKLSSDSRHAFG